MPTKRKPIHRRSRLVITPEIVSAFRIMETTDDDDTWWKAHAVLHQGLGLPPWEFPAFLSSGDECPYSVGTDAAAQWHAQRAARPQAFRLYEELAAALS